MKRRAPWTSGAPGGKPLDRLQAVGVEPGIEHITMHMLRRSLATHLEGHGVGAAMISRIMRHQDERVTETFYRQADERQIAEGGPDPGVLI